jgi:hypothetical protein
MHPLMLCCEFHFAYLERIRMQRRAGMLFATTALIFIVLAACRTRTASVEDDKKAAINVVLAHEQAVQEYDLDKVDSLHMPDARVIEGGSCPLTHSNPTNAKAGRSTRTLASTLSIILEMQ